MTVSLPPASSPTVPFIAYADGPRLLADVGGTNARFALELGADRIELIEVLPCAGYPTLADALRA
ncbi:MAG: glucokinase, partial [Pseudomonadota bacterium]|nr:glucokinase [Pseudomonadota bacterium]